MLYTYNVVIYLNNDLHFIYIINMNFIKNLIKIAIDIIIIIVYNISNIIL